eukprot:CAMPEP_0118854550 /NCGR_PEP_ID=MMETSP1163-20130328/2715_1 /TAXON_ID=124430 /ORGANISM="Phaeomonas parva, Strain CCMP2877" /LENGTH=594 /DNA_ID=CAMNT_0006787291 /DNA_START=27 /DNA_END=1812 /DNA_ORIENTATION=-
MTTSTGSVGAGDLDKELSPIDKDASDPLPTEPVDVVIIGAGLGGLCAGSLLAHYGYKVHVVEAHYHAGGVAHGFERRAKGGGRYLFDAGPSFWAGCGGEGLANPLAIVLNVIGEADSVKWAQYDGWHMYQGDDHWYYKMGSDGLADEMARRGDTEGIAALRRFQEVCAPVCEGAEGLPAFAVRSGWSAAVPLLGKYFPALIKSGMVSQYLTGPASDLMEKAGIERGTFLWNFLDLLSFALSGQPAEGTLGAATAYTMGDLFKDDALIDYPIGGGASVVDALVRGIRKHPGCGVTLKRRVSRISLDDAGRANGIVVAPKNSRPLIDELASMGEKAKTATEEDGAVFIKANRCVLSNADIWATTKLLPGNEGAAKIAGETPKTPSFVHLHLGIDATGLEDVVKDIHHTFVPDMSAPVDGTDNCVLASIPTVLDPGLAPPGKHVVHAYTAGCSDYEDFEKFDRNSEEYKKYRAERVEVLWTCLEKVIPDIRDRAEIIMEGTPLTHERYNRRTRGTYGPGWLPGDGFPGPDTLGVPGLLQCGDSTFPGIGIPAVAASGTIAANSIASIGEHWELLSKLQKEGVLPWPPKASASASAWA